MLDYLNQTLGLNAKIEPWAEEDRLPLYLKTGRKYFLLHIGGTESVLIEADENNFSLPSFRKQMEKLPTQSDNIVLCFKHLDSRRRKALIEAQVPFIVPGSQIYLPFLGVVLQERMKSVRPVPKKLSPTAQMVLIYLINQPLLMWPFRKIDLAQRLNISPMNMTRAVRELEVLDLVAVKKEGRCDHIHAIDIGKPFYKKALPYMIDPVQKRTYVRDKAEFVCLPLAGESALAYCSMLNKPPIDCRAISRKEYKQLEGIEEIDPAWSNTQDYIQLEIWKYVPQTSYGLWGVDVISLELSLHENRNERIEQAVEDMMQRYLGGLPW